MSKKAKILIITAIASSVFAAGTAAATVVILKKMYEKTYISVND